MSKLKRWGFYTRIMSWYYSLKYKKAIVALILIATVFALAMLGSYLSDYTSDSELHKFVFTPETCQNFYGGTPEELADKYSNIQGRYLDNKGNYVVTMDEITREMALATNRAYLKQLESRGVDILVNCTAIVIDANSFMEFNIKQGSPWGIYECAEIQMLNGFAIENIKVKFTVKDFETDEVVYSAVWPQDVIRFTYETENGSYTYGLDGCNSIAETPN